MKDHPFHVPIVCEVREWSSFWCAKWVTGPNEILSKNECGEGAYNNYIFCRCFGVYVLDSEVQSVLGAVHGDKILKIDGRHDMFVRFKDRRNARFPVVTTFFYQR